MRGLRGADYGFVKDSWWRSYRDSRKGDGVNPSLRWVRVRDFENGMDRLIDRLILSADFAVCCKDINLDKIYGWGCASNGVLHYVYVKEPFRRIGIGREIVAALGLKPPLVATHWTRNAEAICRQQPALAIYCPSELGEKVKSA